MRLLLMQGDAIEATARSRPLALGAALTLVAGAVGSHESRGWSTCWQGGLLELGLLCCVAIAVWLWAGVLAWRRPRLGQLPALLGVILMTGPLAALGAYPSIRWHGQQSAIAISGGLMIGIWAWRLLIVARASRLLGLNPVARIAGVVALPSILGGILLFWTQLERAGGSITSHHTPLERAHLSWAYTGSITLVLVIPILLFMGLAVFIMLRDDPVADPPA